MANKTLPLPFETRPQRFPTKRCSKCREIKPITEFYDRSDQPGKKKPSCKKCVISDRTQYRRQHPETDAAYRRDNPEKFREWRRTAYQNGRKDFGRCIAMALSVRRRQCAKKEIPFTITADDVIALFDEQDGLCALTRRQLSWGGEGWERDTLSIDRLDAERGYVPGNLRLVTYQANRARGQHGDDELFAFCEAVLATRAASSETPPL